MTETGTARLPGDEDGELVAAVARGEQRAIAVLYDRYSTVVYSLCMRILRDPADADEVLADVFWQLWSRPERFDSSRGNLIAYLVTLTRSRAIDRLRSRRSRDAKETSDEIPVESGDSPLDEAIFGERRKRIRAALAGLSPDQRSAIELSFYSGLSHGEIANRLEAPLGTIKSRIRNGLIHLRDSLRSLYEDGSST